MVGGSSQVKQMQSLWPEWIWHPLKCGLLLSLLPPSINLSLHCLLLLLPFSPCLFLLYPQSLYQLYLAPHFPLMFFFLLCLFSFSLWSQCKTSVGTPQSVTLLVWPWVCSSVEMTPDLAGLHFTFYSLSQLQPYLATQPCCFSSLSISSCKGQPQKPRARGINRSCTEDS